MPRGKSGNAGGIFTVETPEQSGLCRQTGMPGNRSGDRLQVADSVPEDGQLLARSGRSQGWSASSIPDHRHATQRLRSLGAYLVASAP